MVTPVCWRAATAAPLFPVFSGRIVSEPGELRIEGIYAPPGGIMGRLADRVLLHTAANATARARLQNYFATGGGYIGAGANGANFLTSASQVNGLSAATRTGARSLTAQRGCPED